jgi:hypothetical protein
MSHGFVRSSDARVFYEAISRPERVAALVLVNSDLALDERTDELRAPTLRLPAADPEDLAVLLEEFIEEAVLISAARTG